METILKHDHKKKNCIEYQTLQIEHATKAYPTSNLITQHNAGCSLICLKHIR